ncbi:MAG: serine hydrolase domain-containing protein [Chitinophagaceae bacterium]
MKYLFILLTCLFFSTHALTQLKSTDYSEALKIINIWLDAKRDYDKLPGLSVAIVKDQDIIYKKGFGVTDLEKKTPSGTETLYSICSISKLFTSVAIMQLWEAGKLRLDDSVSSILSSFNLKQQFQESAPITIRSLLTHSSGLPRESDYPYWTGEFKFPTEKEVADKLGMQQTLYPASTYMQYSNLGLTILGQIVAKVSGMPYEKYIEENILKPLSLANTRTYMPQNLWGNQLATGYSALYRDGQRKKLPFFNANGIAAAAGFSSTVEDLARFAAWQFRLLSTGGKELIRASTLREMHRVQWMEPDWKTTWGLGFATYQVDGVTYTGHGGSCPGYLSLLQMNIKEKLGVVVMINAQGINAGKYAGGIFNILNKVKSPSKPDTINLLEYGGYFENYTWRGELVVLPWQGKLALFGLPSDDPANELTLFKYISRDLFRRVRSDDTLGEELRFERDASGKLNSFSRHSNRYRKTDRKV